MPFGLENVGATYKRAITILFHNMIHDIMEDYVDDLLAKTKMREGHFDVLAKIFDRIEQYKVWLNQKKVCVWSDNSQDLGI